jgi:hypothetical protein
MGSVDIWPDDWGRFAFADAGRVFRLSHQTSIKAGWAPPWRVCSDTCNASKKDIP